jgi:putative ABC transport system permease protein
VTTFRIPWLSQGLQDIRQACRSLLRSPGFSVAAILTLALGIGANTAVFSVVNTVLLKPLSYPEPDRIVEFRLKSTEGTVPSASIPDLRFWMQHAEAVDDISAYDLGEAVLGLTSGILEEVHGAHVTSNYFRLFGASLALGRTFSADEDRAGSGKVVVLSYWLWKRRFGGDPQIVGKAISLEKEPYTVVGVTGESFRTDLESDLWIPFQFNLNSIDQLHSFGAAGRLKPGRSLSQANMQLRLASQAAQRQGLLPDPQYIFVLEPLRDAIVRDARASLLLNAGCRRPGAADRLRQRRESVAGSRYRSPAGVRDSSRHRGRSRTAASPVCDRERVAVHMRRWSRSGHGITRRTRAAFDKSWQHSAHWRCGRFRGT